jgi:hypothetical protein
MDWRTIAALILLIMGVIVLVIFYLIGSGPL